MAPARHRLLARRARATASSLAPRARAPSPPPLLVRGGLIQTKLIGGKPIPHPLFSISIMADPPLPSQSPAQTPPQPAPGAGGREDMLACVAVLLLCLPARELQTVDRSLQSSHQSTAHRPIVSLPFSSRCRLTFDPRGCVAGPVSWCLIGPRHRRAPGVRCFACEMDRRLLLFCR